MQKYAKLINNEIDLIEVIVSRLLNIKKKDQRMVINSNAIRM